VEAAAGTITAARVVMTQLEVPVATAVAALRLGRAAGATLLDPAPPAPLPDEAYSLVDVIKPNAREAKSLTGVDVRDRESARRAADVLLGRGARVVAVEAGDEGDLIVARGEEHFLPRLPAKIDPTGPGTRSPRRWWSRWPKGGRCPKPAGSHPLLPR
jgi:ribokinase